MLREEARGQQIGVQRGGARKSAPGKSSWRSICCIIPKSGLIVGKPRDDQQNLISKARHHFSAFSSMNLLYKPCTNDHISVKTFFKSGSYIQPVAHCFQGLCQVRNRPFSIGKIWSAVLSADVLLGPVPVHLQDQRHQEEIDLQVDRQPSHPWWTIRFVLFASIPYAPLF